MEYVQWLVNKGKVWITCIRSVVKMLKLNLPLSQEHVCMSAFTSCR